MKTSWKTAFGVIVLSAVFCGIFGVWEYQQNQQEARVWHHIQAADADSTIGPQTIPQDHMVDGSFASHLPLVVIDTGGQEIVNYKRYDSATDSFRYEDGVDPYFAIRLSVIDHENHVNTLADQPTLQTDAKIKIRGNSSSKLAKSQYRLQLFNEDGEKTDYPIMGMEAADEWILNGTQKDHTYLRNYLSLNVAGTLAAENPDVRYCEVLKKNGEQYEYEGIYLMIEPVSRGKGRVEITAYDPQKAECAWIARRDRYDTTELLLNTYAIESDIALTWIEPGAKRDGYLSLVYPSDKKVTEESVEYITEDISKVERVLYSEDRAAFLRYPQYIDVDSFVDYFLLNEYFMSYDAGLHSTYLYKDIGGKVVMGPNWDFDGGMDNAGGSLTNFEYIVMEFRPWFDRLVADRRFVDQLTDRYAELRKGILSDGSLKTLAQDTEAFLGNAIRRDRSRWREEYENNLAVHVDKATGIAVNRNRSTYGEEVIRLLDSLSLHGEYMDHHISQVDGESEHVFLDDNVYGTPGAILFIILFFVSIILVQRSRRK